MAFVWVAGVAFLLSQVGEQRLGQCIGYITMGATVGELVGPLLGGPLYEKCGHWAVFGVVEVLIAADIGLRLLVRERNIARPISTCVQQHSERDGLLRRTSTQNANTTHPSCNVTLSHLGWNWLGSVLATTVAVIVRCGLETVSPTLVALNVGNTS